MIFNLIITRNVYWQESGESAGTAQYGGNVTKCCVFYHNNNENIKMNIKIEIHYNTDSRTAIRRGTTVLRYCNDINSFFFSAIFFFFFFWQQFNCRKQNPDDWIFLTGPLDPGLCWTGVVITCCFNGSDLWGVVQGRVFSGRRRQRSNHDRWSADVC